MTRIAEVAGLNTERFVREESEYSRGLFHGVSLTLGGVMLLLWIVFELVLPVGP